MKKILMILLLLAFSLPAYAITSNIYEKANKNFLDNQENVSVIGSSDITLDEYAQIIIAPPPPPKREPAPPPPPKKKKKSPPPPAHPEPAPPHPPR